MSDEEQSEFEKKLKSSTISSRLTIVLTVVNIVGLCGFWIQLPGQVKAITAEQEAMKLRLTAAETKGAGYAELLARIDERTRAMQDAARQQNDTLAALNRHFTDRP